MPRLRRYVRGQGFYISGHVPGVGYSTWQIGSEGLGHLASLGITGDGDRIPPHDLRDLLDRNLICTRGEGPGPIDKSSADPALAGLAAALEAWAACGGELRRLVEVVQIGGNNYLDRCFSTTFIDWLESVAPDGLLPELVALKEAAFADLAAKRFAELDKDLLFGQFEKRGSLLVPWRLAVIVGIVAHQLRGNRELPNAWQSQPVLCYLFARLSIRDRPPDMPSIQRTPSRRPPFVAWDVDLQQIVAVMPSQRLPPGATGMYWQVNGDETVRPHVRQERAACTIEESKSGSLKPSEVYEVRVTYAGAQRATSDRWSSFVTTGLIPFVLFHPNGTLVDLSDRDPLLPGEYLALVPPAAEVAVRERRGLEVVERIPLAPVGWPKWTGWRFRIEPGADVEPYALAESSPPVSWELEDPPDPPLIWLDAWPVWLGQLPQVHVSGASSFVGTVLEVDAEPGEGDQARHWDLVIGRDISLVVTMNRASIDLAASPELSGCYGRVRLTCRPPTSLDGPLLTLGFVRLPEMQIGYIADPERPIAALAVRLEPGARVVPGPDTLIAIDSDTPEAVVLRPADPTVSPGVIARLPDSRGEVRVRVPVTRVALSTAANGFLGWVAPPLDDLDLGSCDPGDRMIVELHREPPTEGGRLVTRVPGYGELFVGDSCIATGRSHLFEIELHRWRDGFGQQATGPVQVRGESGWIDLANLRQAKPSKISQDLPTPKPWWGQWIEGLKQAVANGDSSAVEVLARRCLDRTAWDNPSAAAADLLPLAVARATLAVLATPDAYSRSREALAPLVDRLDLPEARILDWALAFRSGLSPRDDGRWTPEELEMLGAELPKAIGRDLLLAEAYYRYAREVSGSAPACWDSCLDLCEKFLRKPVAGTESLTSDAILLREFARLMRYDFRSAAGEFGEGVIPTHAPWVRVTRFANRYVREPRPRPRAYPDLPALPAVAPKVLRADDADRLRAIVDHARGASIEGTWTSLADTPFAELLHARGLLYAGNLSKARDAYSQILKRVRVDGASELLELIAEERPLA